VQLRCLFSVKRCWTVDRTLSCRPVAVAASRVVVLRGASSLSLASYTMLIPKKSRVAVYSYLFREGVIVAKKDLSMKKHKDTNVPNLWVVKLLTSFKSKGFVKEKFNWQWFYWYLTNEGIEYLRDYLNLPSEIVPATLKKPRSAPRSFPPRGQYGDRPPRGEGGYRRPFPGAGGDQEKKLAGAGGDFAPRFAGGEGGGRGGRDSYRRDSGAPRGGPSGARPGYGRGGGAPPRE